MEREALGLLALARKGGNLAAGDEPVREAVNSGRAKLIVIAADAAQNAKDRAVRTAERGNIPAIELEAQKEILGAKLGRGTVAVAALLDGKLAEAFVRKLEREDLTEVLELLSSRTSRAQRRKNAPKQAADSN